MKKRANGSARCSAENFRKMCLTPFSFKASAHIGSGSGGTLLAVLAAALALGSVPCAANPESITRQSALVWRADGTGDYGLPDLKDATTYQLPSPVPTSGQIDKLTATWVCDGPVTLELSADGGVHYTPAVYGVPVSSGLAQGNRVTWRATLGAGSRLSEVKIAYTDSSRVTGDFGEPQLSGFRYRKAVRVAGSTAGAVFHYQLLLAIGESADTAASHVHCEGRVRDDFADLRVTTEDGQTLLPQYREGVLGAKPGRLALLWVKIPQLPQEGLTLYVYYGNPDAADLSDGRAVFDFFDDFQGSTLNPKVWDTRVTGQGSATVSNAQLQLLSASMLSKAFELTDGIVEYLATIKTAQDDARLIIRNDPQASHPDETAQVAYASAYSGAEHVLAVGNVVKANRPQPLTPGTLYGYRVIADKTALTFERYDPTFATLQATVAFEDAGGVTAGAVGLRSDGSAAYRWIRVRQYVRAAPAVVEATVPPKEEVVALPVFTNTRLAPNGNVLLVNPALPGVYQTAEFSTDFLTRIMVPRWKGQPEMVDVSADGGHSYHLSAVPGTHYYSAKGQLTAGKRLLARATLKATQEIPTPQLEALTLEHASGEMFVVSPNGGERWAAGTTQKIVWSALGYESAYLVTLDYSLDGGKTYRPIVDSTENDGRYVWALPEGVTSEEALVRVSDHADPSVFDVSDKPFAIVPPGAAAQTPSSQAPPAQDADAGLTNDLLTLLEKLGADRQATPYELAIKVTDSEAGALGYKAGDIVLIRPAGGEWSEAEKSSFLIIQANLAPQAISMLMSPLEVPTGEMGKDGKPLMRTMGRRKFKIDLSLFDLKPRASDKGKSALLRHYKTQENMHVLVEDRTADQKPGVSPTAPDAKP